MLTLLFVALVVAGFLFWLLATWGLSWGERAARGLFFAAAIVWAVQAIGR